MPRPWQVRAAMASDQRPDRAQIVRNLFEQAVRRPPEERAALLDEKCADDLDLRSEVESLLDGLQADAPSLDRLLESPSSETVDGAPRGAQLRPALQDRYEIEGEIGRGGMATVYVAQDRKHGRKVAIKVLRPELAATLGVDRFLAEIRTAATLQHPHILPLHDSGEAGGLLYYTMPFVAGESLRARIDRGGPLPLDEAVRIATAVAEALDYAHRQGVVHRDVKPANILLHDGQAVVADFGIALAVGKAGGARVTKTGMSLGTPQYMAPEQASGDRPVGPAADIWALGCVLYEMLVGEAPYTGPTLQAVIGKIARGAFEPIRAKRPSVPLHVDAAVCRALEKLPGDRFPEARGLGRALVDPAFRHGGVEAVRRVSGRPLLVGALAVLAVFVGAWVFSASSGSSITEPLTERIAVLPFEDLTNSGGEDGLGRLMAYTVADRLTSLEIAEVVPFADVQVELGTGQTAPSAEALAARTGATLLVEGSFHNRDTAFVVQARVIDPINKVVVAAPPPATGPTSDPDVAVQAMVDRLLGAVALHLDPDLGVWSGKTPKLAAVRAFVDGSAHVANQDWPGAEEDLRRATALDSTFIAPYWVLGVAALHNQRKWGAIDSLVSVLDRRSLVLSDIDRARIDVVRSMVAGRRGQALEAMERIADVSPGMDRFMAGFLAETHNQPGRALDWLESMDPDVGFVKRWPFYWISLSAVQNRLGRYEEELQTIREATGRFDRGISLWAMRPLAALGEASAVEDTIAVVISEGAHHAALFGVASLRAYGHSEASVRSARRVVDHLRSSDIGDGLRDRTALAEALTLAGEYVEARRIHETLATDHPEDIAVQGRLGLAAAFVGDTAEANRVADWLEARDGAYLFGHQHSWRVRIAGALGDADLAARALRQGLGEGLAFNPNAVPYGGSWIWPMEWVFEPIRDDPQFRRLIKPAG